ncbi:pyridoxine/pyridoxamine 5'-phosphate oxidase [Flagellimonas marina]|uniref:Pyridoxal 5'-phosphate synthase n=1 Tax=Flagellimonas marina TaxID=1775168 RepID=A0ABV8PPX9_9FLAO
MAKFFTQTKNYMTPIEIFKKWFDDEKTLSTSGVPSAVCLSTIGLDGFPNARFVSLKALIDDCFIITGPLNSRKALEMKKQDKVALTFWWPHSERQIRIQGLSTGIRDELAVIYFGERSRISQAVSSISKQGEAIENLTVLETKVLEMASEGTKINRPNHWGGFSIQPIRIELMEFKKNRIHERKMYEFENGSWTVRQIQP